MGQKFTERVVMTPTGSKYRVECSCGWSSLCPDRGDLENTKRVHLTLVHPVSNSIEEPKEMDSLISVPYLGRVVRVGHKLAPTPWVVLGATSTRYTWDELLTIADGREIILLREGSGPAEVTTVNFCGEHIQFEGTRIRGLSYSNGWQDVIRFKTPEEQLTIIGHQGQLSDSGLAIEVVQDGEEPSWPIQFGVIEDGLSITVTHPEGVKALCNGEEPVLTMSRIKVSRNEDASVHAECEGCGGYRTFDTFSEAFFWQHVCHKTENE